MSERVCAYAVASAASEKTRGVLRSDVHPIFSEVLAGPWRDWEQQRPGVHSAGRGRLARTWPTTATARPQKQQALLGSREWAGAPR